MMNTSLYESFEIKNYGTSVQMGITIGKFTIEKLDLKEYHVETLYLGYYNGDILQYIRDIATRLGVIMLGSLQ